MRLVKLWALAALALLAFGVVGTAAAGAEEGKDGAPEILCLVTGCVKELKAEFLTDSTGGTTQLLGLGGLGVTATDAHTVLEKCTPLDETEKDTNLCKDQTIDFHGVEFKKLKCSTAGDESGTALLLLDVHIAAEEEPIKKILEPLILAKILNSALKAEPVTITCGGGVAKFEVRGTVACLLLPGLKEIPTTEMVEILCKINTTTHDPETGKCELLCEWLEKEPLEANLNGKFEDAWQLIHLLGFFNKTIFIDD
jgi:hypothetical protein